MKSDQTVDGILRRYLLGTIEPDVREDVEKRLFSDDKIFWEQMCLVEDELIDAYVSDDLDVDERRSFDQHFLTTEERRDKLSFAQALKNHIERERTRDDALSWNPLRGWLFVPSWAAAAAAVLLVVLPVLVWQNARPGASRDDVSAWLSSGLVRSVGTELERLRVPPDAKLVRLRLEIDAAEYPIYRAALHLVSGEEIWSQNNLTPAEFQGRQAVELTLPAELLPAGDYYVRLRGVSPPKDPVVLDRYDFRVLRGAS
jgi:hypothetical protein